MKVAFVSQPFDVSAPPTETGSVQIWTYQVALRLAKKHDVTICAVRHPGEAQDQIDRRVRYIRFSPFVDRWLLRLQRLLWRFPRKPGKPDHASNVHYLAYAYQVARHVRHEGYDVVHVHNFSQFVKVIRWLNPNVGIVLHSHGEWLTQLDRKMIRSRLRKTDLVIGCSHYLKSCIAREIPEVADRTRVIVNGVDPEQFSSRTERNDEGAVEILFVGRHSAEKGVHDLLDAAKYLAELGRNFHLTIVGPEYVVPSDMIVNMSDDPKVIALKRFYSKGPRDQETYLEHLKSQRRDGLESYVEFTGLLPHSELSGLYRRADILTNPSLSETFGMALVEAMASEIPTVATRVGGMVEVVDDGETGLLVESADPVALAAALDRLIQDPELRRRMGRAGRKRVLDLFSWDKVAESLGNEYEALIRGDQKR
jgi:spore coat protein SA